MSCCVFITGIAINGRALKGTIDSLVEVDAWSQLDPLELYQKVFENTFVHESQQYFDRTSQTYLSQYSCSEYMKNVSFASLYTTL